MTKYIKTLDGKFAGSIGEGKTVVPASRPAAEVITVSEDVAPESTETVNTMYEQYQQARKQSVWEFNPEADVSYWHCGRPGYWEYDEDIDEEEVYCSKCQTKMEIDDTADDKSFPFTMGEEYTTHKSRITGTIQEIVPNKDDKTFRLRLDVDGETRWTTAVVAKDN